MFALLDSQTKVTVITDLILSFLPLRFIDYTSADLSRIYRDTSEIGGALVDPTLFFSDTVWADRLSNPDSSNGIRLYALRRVGEMQGKIFGRPFPSQGEIFCDILNHLKQPSHSLCNSALKKLLLGKYHTVTDQEYDYLNRHFCTQLLNIFYEYLESGDAYEIKHSGIGVFLVHLIDTIWKNDRCSEIKESLVEWIVTKLGEESTVFSRFIFSPNYGIFKNIFDELENDFINQELCEKMRPYMTGART